jgi:hypothetical protein
MAQTLRSQGADVMFALSSSKRGGEDHASHERNAFANKMTMADGREFV